MSKAGKSVVLSYLVEKNRPMNATDIHTNLNGQVSKTQVSSFLDELAADKKIVEKLNGKQKIYMALQTTDCTNIKSDLRALDETLFTLKNEVNLVKNENGRLDAEVKGSELKVPLPELEKSAKKLETDVEELKAILAELKSTKIEVVSKEEKLKISKEREKWVKEWRKYKRLAMDMLDIILENVSMKKDKLCEDLGLILDEHEKVKMIEL